MKKKSLRIALISTPWPFYSRPSIQLGAVKAYLHFKHPDVEVHADHAFLKIAASLGYPLYQEISERTWLAEAVYAALLYPQRFDVIEKLFNRLAKPGSLIKKIGFKKITSVIKKTTDALIADCNWKNYQLAGFSVSLCQLTSALYFIKSIKKSGAALPSPFPYNGKALSNSDRRMKNGLLLLAWFLNDGRIRGVTPSGDVFEHLVSETLTRQFVSGLSESFHF